MSNDAKITMAIHNYESAVQTLLRFLALPVRDDRDRAGVIQAFEFCYELSWQTLKKVAEHRGLQAPTPLQAFQAGFQMGLIGEGEQSAWLDMKKTRNLTTHTYQDELAKKVFDDIAKIYVGSLNSLLARLISLK